MTGEDLVGLFTADLSDEDIPPADLATVGLQLDRAARENGQAQLGGLLLVEVVLEDGVIDDQLIIEPDTDSAAHHHDAEMVPFPKGLVRLHERILARRAFLIVPKTA